MRRYLDRPLDAGRTVYTDQIGQVFRAAEADMRRAEPAWRRHRVSGGHPVLLPVNRRHPRMTTRAEELARQCAVLAEGFDGPWWTLDRADTAVLHTAALALAMAADVLFFDSPLTDDYLTAAAGLTFVLERMAGSAAPVESVVITRV